MKKIILILFLAYSTILSATKYYVSTSGNDANNGLSESTPWRTLYYAEAHATTPGDIIALKKGNIWTSSELTALTISHGGSSGHPIVWDGGLWGTGKNAIIQSISGDMAAIVRIAACDYVTFQNITIDGNNMRTYGLVIGGDINNFGSPDQYDERNIIFQDSKILDCGDGGSGDYSISLVCQTKSTDMYNITIQRDTIDGNSNHGIAFYNLREDLGGSIAPNHNSYIGYNYITNCGRLKNGVSSSIMVTIDQDVSIVEHNTIRTGNDGGAPGIAIGSDPATPNRIPKGVIVRYNDILIEDGQALFFQNGGAITADLYYNLFHASGQQDHAAVWIQYASYPGADIDFYNNVMIQEGNEGSVYMNDATSTNIADLRNNIVIHTGTISGGNYLFVNLTSGSTTHGYNSYHKSLSGNNVFFVIDGGTTYTRSNVDSWETTCVKTDPLFIDFGGSDFHLQSGSPVIGKGVTISGITTDFDGNTLNSPPDLGCFASCEISANPVYLNSAVENATPSRLEMTYNLTLANIVPAASAFTVNVNSAVRSVSTVSISGTKVLLTLGSPVVYGDVVTVAYTKPSANQLQTTSGGQAATITAQNVTNRVNPISPAYVSSAVENATPSRLEMTYNLTLANIVPAVSAFTVNVNSAVRSVSTVSVSGTKVLLTLGSPVVVGDIVTVAYTKPSANQLQTTSGGQAATITAQTVTNRVNPVSPAYVSSTVENATPSRLEMTYNLTLANIVPAASAFTVNVNSAVRSVSTVSISGTKVLLTLGSPIVVGDVVTVAYTKPSANQLQTTTGGQAATITAQTVTNRVNPVSPAYVSSAVENATPSRVEMTYNMTLANIVPAVSAFTVNVNTVVRSVSTVSISGTKVLLTLGSPVVVGDVVTVAYTKPSANPLQTTSGGQAATITAQTVTNRVNPVSPAYVSSAVENATPSRVEMTYNMTLANIVPAVSAFTVNVNSVVRSVSTVSISGTKVLLTLGSPVVVGDVVTVAYTKPSANQLQTTTGGQAATITAQTVTNRVNPVSPAYVSSAVENATPSRVEMTYNMTLANIVPAVSAFTVNVNSVVRSVSTVSISGTKVLLTLGSLVVYGDVVTVAYTKPSANPLQTTSGGQAATITARTVTNRVNPVSPAYVSSAVENATPSRLEMTYNLTLANIVPAVSTFTVNVNSVVRSVSTVAISGTKVLLTLGSPVVYGDVVTVAYTKPSANPLQTTSGGQAATINARTVTNNCLNTSITQNQLPIIRIVNPKKNCLFMNPATVTIEANAYDPDGNLMKVEFFNGSRKLGERTSVPYIFVWENVPRGRYTLTARAYDNSNAIRVSNTVHFYVMDPYTIRQAKIEIVEPSQDKKIIMSEMINIIAESYDPDNVIKKVEYFAGLSKIGESNTAPYSISFESSDSGTIDIEVVASDSTDNMVSYAIVTVDILSIDEATGLSKVSPNSDPELLNIYPNPNDGRFMMDLKKSFENETILIKIINTVGKTVYSQTLSNGETNLQFDLNHLNSGLYFMVVSGDEINITKKFIIK